MGFGAIAGPCTLGGVGVPSTWVHPRGLTDSKLLSAKERDRLAEVFTKESKTHPEIVSFLCSYSSEEIDARGLGKCRSEGLTRSVLEVSKQLPTDAKILAVVDGNLNLPHSRSIPKADLIVPAVSMASVLAKVSRDAWMTAIDGEYPGYDFKSHKGYETSLHYERLLKLGPCPIHRKSTSTVAWVIRSVKKDEIEGLMDILDP